MFRIVSSFSLRPIAAAVLLMVCLLSCRQRPVGPSGRADSVFAADTSAARRLLRSAKSIAESQGGAASKMYDSAWHLSLAEKDTWAISMSLLGKGIGMFAIHARVEAFRGKMDVGSSPAGTSVNLRFPVPIATVTANIS